MTIVQLCTGILRRGPHVLLVQSVYEGEPEPLWTLPGGRQEDGETKSQTVAREFLEETSLRVRVGELAYVSESIDSPRGFHVLNTTFHVQEDGEMNEPRPQDPNVVGARFVSERDAPALLRADVLRIPVEATLAGAPKRRYFSFRPEDVVEPFFRTRDQDREDARDQDRGTT